MQQNSNTTCGIRPVCVWVNKLKVVQETYRVVCLIRCLYVCLFCWVSKISLARCFSFFNTRSSAVAVRPRTLVVVEYFAKSLKVTQGHSKRHCWLPIRIPLKLCLYIVPFLRYSVSKWRRFETGGRSRLRSLKMAPFDRSYTTFYWSAIVSITTTHFNFNPFYVVPFSSYLTLNNHDIQKVTVSHSN